VYAAIGTVALSVRMITPQRIFLLTACAKRSNAHLPRESGAGVAR
jgi:hypothetical protein